MMHLNIVGLSELHVINRNFPKGRRFTANPEYKFFWAIDEDKTESAAGCALVLKNELAKHIQKIQTYKGRLIAIIRKPQDYIIFFVFIVNQG